MKLSYAFNIKNNKKYYFITLNNRGLDDHEVSELFKVSFDEYVDILVATGAIIEDDRGYIFNTIEDVENAIITLKILLDEP